ncbi:Uncharacterized protein APZ42_033406 [Daphnia magna]|uniref:Uncharacterized protein n=1 Tax=Daphnia magna TaxID=35525 RepID=A0A164L4B9_9CRUS|nr:Uncharacterized protein APZ42_033406 [Daphnia magna]
MPPRHQLTDAERARVQYVRDEKKQCLDQEVQRQTQYEETRRARLDVEAQRRKENRAQDEIQQAWLQQQALRQQALREEENEEERRARLRDQAKRQQAVRSTETANERRTEEDRASRIMVDAMRHQVLRVQQTVEERMSRAMVDRLRHQMRLVDETHEEVEVRREINRQHTVNYRAAEKEEEREERRAENQFQMELLREEREENEKLLRAMNALEHAEIILAACKTLASEDRVLLHDCGKMTVTCGECNARNLQGERPTDNKFTQCWVKGKVILPTPKECPHPLVELLQNDHPKAIAFMTKIRNYNSAHAFASLVANISSPPRRGPYCFRIHGQVYHNTKPFGPNTNNLRYADLYFVDAAQASEFRALSTSNGGCCRNLMEELDAMLREKNSYVAIYKIMLQVLEEEYR